MSTTTPVDARAETRTGPGPAAAGAVTGLVAGVAATVTGLVLGLVLNVLGATTTAPLRLGTWLTGLGLGGGWHQVVTSDLPTGAGWTTWVAGAPLLVTAAAGLIAARLFRRYSPGIVGVAMACLTFGIVAAAVVVLSIVTETTTSDSGTVDSSMGLTWLWTGGLRPGTVVGAILLMLVVGLATTVLRPHWDAARGVAWGVAVVPGVVFTVVLLAGVFYLTSQPVAALTVGLLMPLAGTAIMFGLGGAPVSLGLTRAAPEPYTLDTWQAGPLAFAAGVVVVLVIAVLVGLVLRRRRNACPLGTGVIATALFALWVTWLMDTTVGVPAALGADTAVAVCPIGSAVVAGVMAAVALLVRGRRSPAE